MNTNENIPIQYPAGMPRYTAIKPPKKQFWFTPFIVPLLEKILMGRRKYTLTKYNMEYFDAKENRKKPFLLIFTHMQFSDMPIFFKAILPRKSNSASTVDGFCGAYKLVHNLGRSIPVRKFGDNKSLIQIISQVINKNKSVFNLAPEAQYTLDGMTGTIPDSTGKLVKFLGAPVVAFRMNGNYINGPTWGDNVPRIEYHLHPTMTYLLTPEDIQKMSASEITAKVREAMEFNEWKYWRESGNKVTYKNRAAGIENILYKCPECNHEFNMQGTGATIKCGHCNFEWELTEDGFLKGITRESKFTFPDEWLKWERCECIKELESGNYNYSDTVQGFSAPNTRKLVRLERMHVTHTVNGLTIDGKYRGQDFHYYFKPTHSYNIQTELKCPNFPGKPTILGTNTSDDTLYFVPSMPGMAYKINTAWKELFRMKGINTAGQTPH